jgi:phenylalanine ammonia-lyase
VLEDFVAAHETITTELNSSTDNPLFDPLSEQLYHGGNFQAAAVTNAVEKIRDGLSTIGRLIFAQQSELLNPQRSNGLPTCLAPSLGPNKDGGLKGLDIANASYLSELNFLANRVNHFVQCAEMDNQCVNSLALISARFTVQAAEVLKKLMANAVYGVLQAIDLRMGMCRLVVHLFETSCLSCAGWSTFTNEKKAMLIHTIIFELMQTSHLDIQERSEIAARAFCHVARKEGIDLSLSFRPDLYPNHTELPLEPEEEAEKRLAELLDSCYVGCHVLDARPHNPSIRADSGEDNHSFLASSMTGALWSFVRGDLGVGSYTGLAEYSWAFTAGPRDGRFDASYRGQPPGGGKTIGAEVSKIFDAFQNGKFDAFLRQLLQRERPGGEAGASQGSETGDARTAAEIMSSLGIY